MEQQLILQHGQILELNYHIVTKTLMQIEDGDSMVGQQLKQEQQEHIQTVNHIHIIQKEILIYML